ncbi:carboxypeptidase [Bacillus tropicus]|uniref:Carboxypeptidase n=2 Tax=Bacillaceae TaxID=186817 RepID=A0A5C5A4X2_9BACI|nr:carboxypeptidase [Bacillus thuringiensis serovar tochigiensis BGSC 4Y1]OJD45232.1 carboxypeptidase [Bacillus sp. L27]OOL09219.1 carboxypeptidase [Bacillus cereus]PJZ18531.1 carboxypeptidase [Bacillus cereus]TNP13412.1 carboxypeptidase [Bacillus tropicus]
MNKALFFQSKVEVQKYDQNHKDNIDNTGTTSIIQKKEIVKEHISQGNLLLINSTYPIRQESVKSDIVNLSKHNELINGYGLLNTNVYLSKEVAKKFSEMINNVVKEGVNQFFIKMGKIFDFILFFFQNKTIEVEIPVNEFYGIYGENIDGVIVTTRS